ncbi:hypothetical protein [Thiohalophilus sp.]|uniref:hypothetical protein n=1 Tax=Thiohalophilus sp. TaxID=3028392 RepID=UPI002ACE079D|nr:hypothetical protein [Thiohalophilus sp.]MDZ7804708.1 hypothetical protein [Thiohalophilus sp.]
MTAAINAAGNFTRRPELGSGYRSARGELVIVAASWVGGVVFLGGGIATARELLDHYQPDPTHGGSCHEQCALHLT